MKRRQALPRVLQAALATLALLAALPQAPATTPALLARTLAGLVHGALPSGRPGYGVMDYPGNTSGDVPKAYAMVLLAEFERSDERANASPLARTAGKWLLEHADANGDGVIGWGLPVAWDANEDGSVNPPHTEYAISTAIAIDALLTWAERDAQAPVERIRRTVAAAIAPYLDRQLASASGMAPYSLQPADRRYDIFNPAVYLAGQIQRASLGIDDAGLRQRLAAAADATMHAVLEHRRIAPGSGHWYWNYSVQQELPNDLPHAGYMIGGIRTYIEHGGRLAERFDWPAVLAHLRDFQGADGKVRAFPRFAPSLTLAARTYDIGFALHLVCTEAAVRPLLPWLVGALEDYRDPASRYLKYPVGSIAGDGSRVPELVINEYETYLYRGLATCAAQHRALRRVRGTGEAGEPGAVPLRTSAQARDLAHRLAGGVAGAEAPVPLLPADAGIVVFDAARRPRITTADGTQLAVAMAGVPVQVLRHGASTWIFQRAFPDDRLWLLRLDGGRQMCMLPVDHGDDLGAPASLRAATVHAGRLHAVYYHNASLGNWHVAWNLPNAAGECPRPAGARTALPSLEDPAGVTYEMIAPLRFHAGAGPQGLVLAGGNLEIEIGPAGPGALRRLPGCRHVIESAPTPRGLAHLCAPVHAGAAGRAPIVVAPAGIEAPRIDRSLGVPWRLRWSLGRLHVDHARSTQQLRQMLRRDLARTAPSGWKEFGINNTEGRIPWSQVYYLDGLIDLLQLAGRDPTLLDLFGPLLREVRQRLDMEMRWLDAHVAAGRHRTRAFTVDRSEALFGVQTARLLLLMHRYRAEVPDGIALASYAGLERAVQRLEGHIEVLATTGEEAKWIRPGLHHLRWPKGSKFAFDGMAVPYNHQNEWAHAVLATAGANTPAEAIDAASDVLRHFVDRIAPAATLPAIGAWDYWWGRAYDGWDEPGRYSINTPRYAGDRIKAWISFRTIDAMALAAGAHRLGPLEAANARASAMDLATRGLLYPLANRAWLDDAAAIHLGAPAALEHARVSAPWEVANAVWSLAALARRWQGE